MGDFEVVRKVSIAAPPQRVRALIDDFRSWREWSPWEGVDPALEREYSGAPAGVGAHYAWSGNRKAGKGSMEIVESTPELVGIRLQFEKPWKATNDVRFELSPTDGGTDVAWRMTGTTTGFAALLGKLVPMDRMVGKDFEKGLAQLKALAESG